MTLSNPQLPDHFAIRNARLWTVRGEAPAQDLIVRAGRIEKIIPTGTETLPETVFDAHAKVLMPVGVDLQVHLRVPGQSEKETAETGLRAALKGGVGVVVSMPNTRPIIDNVLTLQAAQREVAPYEEKFGVKALFTVAMTQGQEGRDPVEDVEALKNAGAVALTDDGKGVAQDSVMEALFKVSAATGLPLLQHAEIPGHGTALAAGPTQKTLGLKAYPVSAETDMIDRDLRLFAKYPQARYHVLHLSSHKSLDLIAAAKKSGLKNLSCEVTPHHLFFSSDDIPEKNTDFKMNPPLRSPVDQKALRAALCQGLIDFVSTDHAPHEKSKKGEDFTASAFGTTGLETSLRTLLSMYQQGELAPARVVEVFSQRPAQFLGIDKDYGDLAPGRRLAAAWVDVEAPAVPVQLGELESLSKNNCFLGAPLPGKILGVFNQAGLFRF